MRSLLCLLLLATTAHAGEVWVVKPKASTASVWVVTKQTTPAKTCECSNQCSCGCNSGKTCECNKRSTQAIQQPVIQYASPSVLCIGGT
jgi:hypothetical protein